MKTIVSIISSIRPLLLLILLIMMSGTEIANAQQKQAYILYNSKGKKISYSRMMQTLSEKDILLFGEYHNNAIAHWLQFEV
jgi:uncharacterized iron-regulated protein